MRPLTVPSLPFIIRTTDGRVPAAEPGATVHGHRRLLQVLVVLVALVLVAQEIRPAPVGAVDVAIDVVLADSGLAIPELVQVVEAAADRAGIERPIDELTVVLTDSLPGHEQHPFLGGLQDGATVWVRMDGLAMPSRTLLHEVAHALTPGDGHGERFREVYLAAMEEVYGAPTAAREARRLAWVYDKCYRDGSCPSLDRA